MDPIIFLSSPKESCLTFYWRDVPGLYIGYRFQESSAEIPATLPSGYAQAAGAIDAAPFPNLDLPPYQLPAGDPLFRRWQVAFESDDLAFQSFEGGLSACWMNEGEDGLREMAFLPEEDGVRMWLRFTAAREITGGLAVQQCLRFTGRFNAPWRVEVAHFPLLSELDMQAMGRPNATLTWARQGGEWLNFPVPYSAYPTQPGQPYLPGMPPLDHGLILRESPHRAAAPAEYWNRAGAGAPWQQISAGMFWERTAFVSNRHPADCLHAWLDLGPLAKGETRVLRGKMYLVAGDKDDLLEAVREDFTGV